MAARANQVGQVLTKQRFAAMHGLYWLSVNLADRKPVLLTVDDCNGLTARRSRGWAASGRAPPSPRCWWS